MDPANLFYSSLNGVLFDKSQSRLIAYPGGLGGNYTIPGSVASLDDYAFYGGSGPASVTIPASVTNLGNCQFYDCSGLTNANIGNGISSVGNNAFYFSSRLARVTIAAASPTSRNAFNVNRFLANVFFQGNPPAVNSAFVHLGHTQAPRRRWSIICLARPAGLPLMTLFTTMLWNPLIQAGASGFGVQTNHFGFNITGTANIPIVVEACTNLASPVWTPLQSLLAHQRFALLQRDLPARQPRPLLPHPLAMNQTPRRRIGSHIHL